ncbi:MAG TPA: YceI family protein, partial [Xanthomonadales bacterium]|nr:YceI family protein [Xanthomonadales bacterium]
MRATLLPFLLLASGATLAHEERYTLDPDHTYPSMEVPHMGLSVFRGKFNRTTGTATIDREAHTGTIEAHIDMASVDFGHDKVNEHLRTKDFFDVATHPEAVYRGKLVFAGDEVVAVDGELTLLAVTKPLRLAVNQFACVEHPYFKKPWCAGDASAKLERADFGMGMG